MKLGLHNATALNICERQVHCTRHAIMLSLISGPAKCNICGLPLSHEGRVWKEGDEVPERFKKMKMVVKLR